MQTYPCSNPNQNQNCRGRTAKKGGLCRSCGIKAAKARKVASAGARLAAAAGSGPAATPPTDSPSPVAGAGDAPAGRRDVSVPGLIEHLTRVHDAIETLVRLLSR